MRSQLFVKINESGNALLEGKFVLAFDPLAARSCPRCRHWDLSNAALCNHRGGRGKMHPLRETACFQPLFASRESMFGNGSLEQPSVLSIQRSWMWNYRILTQKHENCKALRKMRKLFIRGKMHPFRGKTHHNSGALCTTTTRHDAPQQRGIMHHNKGALCTPKSLEWLNFSIKLIFRETTPSTDPFTRYCIWYDRFRLKIKRIGESGRWAIMPRLYRCVLPLGEEIRISWWYSNISTGTRPN